jgi:hypothetical protein
MARLLCLLGFHRWVQTAWAVRSLSSRIYSAKHTECARCRVGRYT